MMKVLCYNGVGLVSQENLLGTTFDSQYIKLFTYTCICKCITQLLA